MIDNEILYFDQNKLSRRIRNNRSESKNRIFLGKCCQCWISNKLWRTCCFREFKVCSWWIIFSFIFNWKWFRLLSFKSFLSGVEFDERFSAQVQRCDPCSTEYDYILKVFFWTWKNFYQLETCFNLNAMFQTILWIWDFEASTCVIWAKMSNSKFFSPNVN